MSDETPEEQVGDGEPDEDADEQSDEDESAAQPVTDSETEAHEVDAQSETERPSRPTPKPGGLPPTTTTGDPDLDVRQPGAGAVDQGDALDREREGEDVRGHPEDHG